MTPCLSREQSRLVDQIALEQYHIPGVVLMENAGRNCAELLLAQEPNGPVTILVGKGNNAGDGFVIARHLHNRQVDVRLVLMTSPEQFQGDALANWRIVQAMRIPWTAWQPTNTNSPALPWMRDSCWIVDALLGTGIQGMVREPFAGIISAANRQALRPDGPRILAIDLPSGLDCDTGQILGVCIQADLTATCVAPKIGFRQNEGLSHTGKVHVIDIGVPHEVLEQVSSLSG